MNRPAVFKWTRRVIVWGMAVAGIYFAVYLWARRSGRLRNDAWGYGRQIRLCWAPADVCERPPHPVGEDVLTAAFRPAAALESMAPEFFESMLKPDTCRDFRGRFSEKEARRYIKILLGRSVGEGATFAGGEFDSSQYFGVVRFAMSESEFRQWFSPIYRKLEFDHKADNYYQMTGSGAGFLSAQLWSNQPPRQSVWWKDGVTYIREDYGLDYSPDLKTTRLKR